MRKSADFKTKMKNKSLQFLFAGSVFVFLFSVFFATASAFFSHPRGPEEAGISSTCSPVLSADENCNFDREKSSLEKLWEKIANLLK
jgi:hypothetical protein